MKYLFCSMVAVLLLSSSSFAASSAAPSADVPSSDKYNFRFSPIMLLVGGIKVNLDYVVAPDWTVGPTLSYWHYTLNSDPGFITKYDITSSSIGVRANWFKNGALTQGLYVGPSIEYMNVKLETSDAYGKISGTASGLFLTGIVGYGWFWESFNMMLGGGAVVGLGDTKVSVKDSSGRETSVTSSMTSGVGLEYSLGWKF